MNKPKIQGIFIMMAMILFDQLTKILAYIGLKGKEPIAIIKNVLELQYLENNGAAFSMLQGKKMLFLILTTVVMIFLIIVYCRMPETKRFRFAKITVMLLICGAIGNYIDRSAHTYVIDFIYFKLIDFPIFNVADIYVTFACLFLIIGILFIYKDHEFDEMIGIHKREE